MATLGFKHWTIKVKKAICHPSFNNGGYSCLYNQNTIVET